MLLSVFTGLVHKQKRSRFFIKCGFHRCCCAKKRILSIEKQSDKTLPKQCFSDCASFLFYTVRRGGRKEVAAFVVAMPVVSFDPLKADLMPLKLNNQPLP